MIKSNFTLLIIFLLSQYGGIYWYIHNYIKKVDFYICKKKVLISFIYISLIPIETVDFLKIIENSISFFSQNLVGESIQNHVKVYCIQP